MAGSKRKQTPKKRSTKQTRVKRQDAVREEPPQPRKSARLAMNATESTADKGKGRDKSLSPSTSKPRNALDLEEDDDSSLELSDLSQEPGQYSWIVRSYLEGNLSGWERDGPASWGQKIDGLNVGAWSISKQFGIETEEFDKLPKKDREEIFESVKEYFIRGDVDEVAARFAGKVDRHFSHCLLNAFLCKHILSTFWGDNCPFWWLEPDLQTKDTSSVPSEFGAQFNRLYKAFLRVDRTFAYVWAMMTIRLSKTTTARRDQGDNYEFAKYLEERRRSAVHSAILPRLLANRTMQLLLKDAEASDVSRSLQKLLVEQAENAVSMYSYPCSLRIGGFEHMPINYLDLPEKDREYYRFFFLDTGDDTPLHGKKVLATTQPAIYRQGVVGEEVLVSPGKFIIDWDFREGRNMEIWKEDKSWDQIIENVKARCAQEKVVTYKF